MFPREGILGLCFQGSGARDMVFPREGILGLCC